MNYIFVPMNKEYADQIVSQWKYQGEYSIYNYSNEAEHILDDRGWGKSLFAVLDEEGDLIGELTIEFFNKDDDFIEYEDYRDEVIQNAIMWVGFGLKPGLTGSGMGTSFVTACVEFAINRHHYTGEYVGLGVAAFNKRAIKVYQRSGFCIINRTMAEVNGKKLEVLEMRKKLQGKSSVNYGGNR